MQRLQKQISMALSLVYSAHATQLDKAGKPYVLHPITVGMTLANQGFDEDTVTAGLLHDVIEDTDYTLGDLQNMGFSQSVLDALSLLTHDKSVDYFKYINKIKTNPIAKAVKMADLLHNSDRNRLYIITDEDEKRFTKYEQALEILKT